MAGTFKEEKEKKKGKGRPMIRATANILAALFILCASAHADPFALPQSRKAKHLLKEGNKQLSLRDYDAAIKLYKRGFLIEAKPVFLHNLGLANRLKHDYESAIGYYQTFLRETNPRAKVRAGIENLIKGMQDELTQAARTKPPIEPEPRKPTTPPTSQSSTTTAPWYADGSGWGISTAGLIAGGFGVGLLMSSSSLRDDAERELSFAKKDELNGKADTRKTWGTILGVAGVATLATGIIKLILHDKPSHSTTGISVAVGFDSIRLQGRF